MINFVYIPCDDNFIEQHISPDNFICDINIYDSEYSIDSKGCVYPNVKIRDSKYLEYILNTSLDMNNTGTIDIYVNMNDISQFDKYDVYVLYKNINTQSKVCNLYWKFKSRSSLNNYNKSISLIHAPSTCPMCGEPLYNDLNDFLSTNIKQCTNSSCWIHRYTAINRFLIVSCKLPQLIPIMTPFINIGRVINPSDLYKLDVYDNLFASDDINKWTKSLELLAETRSNIKLSDYLMSLPLVDYDIDGFWINTRNIDGDFKPESFLMYLRDATSKYINYYNTYSEDDYDKDLYYKYWLESYGVDITMYMSIPAFFEYAKYFDGDGLNNNNVRALSELVDLKVFKRNEFIT